MGKKSKRIKELSAKIDKNKVYQLEEAVALVKETSNVKFDASVEIHVNLGIDPKKGDQIIRSTVTLPHGSGKEKKIAAFTSKIDEAKKAGANIAGDDDLIAKIKKTGKCDFDVAVATPDMMPKIAKIAQILGQKGLMPNPKSGTIGPNIEKIIKELKGGKETFKNDDSGNLHLVVGKVSFDDKKLIENASSFMDVVKSIKPSAVKGTYIRGVALSSSMGPSIKLSL